MANTILKSPIKFKIMKTNSELQKDVQDEINWAPMVELSDIGVTAKDGIITLTGVVNSYSKKMAAENAAKRVVGVKGVAEEIEIKFGTAGKKSDADIAHSALNAIKWDTNVSEDGIRINVENGYVKLEGEVDWNYQKVQVENDVKHLIGVRGVSNNITLKKTADKLEKMAVENALDRNAYLNDEDIRVSVEDHKVTLIGCVGSWYDKDEAARVAWSAPGVWSVDNELVVNRF